MTDTEILSQMFKSSVLAQVEKKHSKHFVRLSEPEVPNLTAIIRDLPPDAMVIKVDAFPAPNNFFEGERGECKRADFIIISETRKVILYIELKAGPREANHIKQQLKGASCVVAYCKEVGIQFWNKNKFLNGYANRYAAMVKLSMNKRPTRPESGPLHDSPASFMKLSHSKDIQFNKLVRI